MFPATALDDGYVPLAVPLNGKVLRPWCHFELTDSDYLSAGRRDPGLLGPAGRLGALDWCRHRPLSEGAAAFAELLRGAVAEPKIILDPWG